MSLINCPECRKEISNTVKKCPNCGYKFKNKLSKKLKLLFILMPTVIVITCAGLFIYLNALTETEQHVVECVQEVKDRLKNPDSLQIYEIQYYPRGYDLLSDNNEECSYLMIYFGAANGFGGTTSSYVSFKDWSIQGFYDPSKSYDTNDSDDIDDLITSFMSQTTGLVIMGYWDNSDNINVNINKIMRHVE